MAFVVAPNIFDLFSQTGAPPPCEPAGLGIGLTLAKNLTELHGGRIEVHSDGLGRLRQQPGCDQMLLIALSGYGSEQDRMQATAAGFDHHLTKPANLGELHAMLRNVRVNR